MMLGAWVVVRGRLGDGAFAVALLVSLAGACGAVALAATVSTVAWMVPLWAVGGVFNGSVNVSSGVLVARRAPAEARGRAFALFGGVANGATPTASLPPGLRLAFVPPRAWLPLPGPGGLLVRWALRFP